jgi:CRP/FNR family cyclic AMP-dependent transcriptional regulator
MSVEDAIKDSYIAQGLSEQQLRKLYGIAHFRTYSDGETMLRQFDTCQDLMILASGKAQIMAVVGEPIGQVRAGMPLGEISFIDDRPRSVSVVSMGVSEAVVLPAEDLRAVLDENPDMEIILLRNLSRVLCARLRSANNNIAALMAIDESDAALRR